MDNKTFCEEDNEEINTGYGMGKSEARHILKISKSRYTTSEVLNRHDVSTARKVLGE
ncbi:MULTISPECIES: hypothetical protein [Methanobacterium]|uniref:hypothetical protein n=1 Tax=Methanobacterium TaxID=2160 RepID=UPI00159F32E9|nr:MULTISPECIES: hypothetical protein [Methanobacterium]